MFPNHQSVIPVRLLYEQVLIMDEEVFECEGKNGGVLFSDGSGYFYRVKDKRSRKQWRILCSTSKCTGKGSLVNPGTDDCKIVLQNGHSCIKNDHFIEVTKVRKAILKRCAEENTKLSQIFLEETTKGSVTAEIASALSFSRMESTMVKIRRRSGCPHIPNTYEELSQEIIAQGQRFDNVHGQSFFSGVVGEGDESAIIFIIDQMKELLVSSEELHIDGTFKCVPKKPKSLQMCTIMAVYHDQTLPVVFCLMKRRTSAVYRKIFQHLRIILPNLNPTCVISDYEAAIKSAVTSEFPEARHVGCWFHYAQCIFKKILNLGLAGAYRNDPVINKSGQMLIALALLPSEYIERGYQRIQEFFLEQTEVGEDISRKMDQLLSYFKNQWLTRVGPASFSVFQQVRRSNNAQESFHNRFMGIIGTPHPNIWNFLGALIQVAKLTIAETIALESNVQVRRNRKTKWLQQDRKIKEEQERLVSSAVTDERIERFLAVMAYRCSLRVRPVPAASAADPEEDQDDELVPLQGASDNVSHNSVSVETVLQQRRRLGEIRMNVPDQLAEEGDLTCVACRSFKRNYCVRPCNHLVLCTRCATVHRATERRDSQGRPLLVTCPLCRTVVADYIQIYL